MKPSERIAELAKEILDDIERRAPPANFILHRQEYSSAAHTRAIVKYLDEAFDTNMLPDTAAALADRTSNLNERLKKIEESEPKRRAVYRAINLLGSANVPAVRAALVEAGLPEHIIYGGENIADACELIVDEAKKAGIL